ncbi:hypothetical protein D9M72_647210 [compost metagenome]
MVQFVEDVGIRLARERADDLAHAAGFQQGRQTDFGVAGIVIDDNQVLGALGDKAVDEFGRLAGTAEAANHDGGAVVDFGQGLLNRRGNFVDHVFRTNILLKIRH